MRRAATASSTVRTASNPVNGSVAPCDDPVCVEPVCDPGGVDPGGVGGEDDAVPVATLARPCTGPTFAPAGVVPVALATFVTFPAATSAALTWCRGTVQLIDSPGTNVARGQVTAPASGSLTVT